MDKKDKSRGGRFVHSVPWDLILPRLALGCVLLLLMAVALMAVRGG